MFQVREDSGWLSHIPNENIHFCFTNYRFLSSINFELRLTFWYDHSIKVELAGPLIRLD